LGRLRTLSGREVCRILALEGFSEIRQRGSHVVMQARGPDGTVVEQREGEPDVEVHRPDMSLRVLGQRLLVAPSLVAT